MDKGEIKAIKGRINQAFGLLHVCGVELANQLGVQRKTVSRMIYILLGEGDISSSAITKKKN